MKRSFISKVEAISKTNKALQMFIFFLSLALLVACDIKYEDLSLQEKQKVNVAFDEVFESSTLSFDIDSYCYGQWACVGKSPKRITYIPSSETTPPVFKVWSTIEIQQGVSEYVIPERHWSVTLLLDKIKINKSSCKIDTVEFRETYAKWKYKDAYSFELSYVKFNLNKEPSIFFKHANLGSFELVTLKTFIFDNVLKELDFKEMGACK